MKLKLLLVLAALSALLFSGTYGAGSAGSAAPRTTSCSYVAHTCPSAHHTYLWQGLYCTDHANERLVTDTKTVVVDGKTYWCGKAQTGKLAGGGSSGTTTTTTTTSSGSTGATKPQKTVLMSPRTQTSGCKAGVLPDRACSPGAYDANVTQADIHQTICVSGYTATVRNVPQSEKDAVYHEYGLDNHPPRSYEIDHIVSLELGGSNDVANLFPEKYAMTDGARTKDKLENKLGSLTCAGQITLKQARFDISSDWLIYLHKYHLG
jgi:hypothetical protein